MYFKLKIKSYVLINLVTHDYYDTGKKSSISYELAQIKNIQDWVLIKISHKKSIQFLNLKKEIDQAKAIYMQGNL